jgi:flagellar hook-associated protein 1 FlgK
MTLASALGIANTSFRTIGAESANIANNIANANTPGYSAEVANLATTSYNGVQLISITRDANAALTQQVQTTTSDSAMQSAIATGVAALAQTVSDSSSATSTGALSNGASPAALLANFQSALTTYESAPNSLISAQAAVSAAQTLAGSLNSASQTVTQVRTQADSQIATDVASVNSLLNKFETVNNSIITGLGTGANVGALQDQRDQLVAQISKYIGVSTSINGNGSMAIFTDGGQTLFQTAPYDLSFQPSGEMGAGIAGNQVLINGQPITGSSTNTPIQSGEIAGLIDLRDTIAPQYQTQLDQFAGNLITAFQETDQSTSATGLPAEPGLFTAAGLTGVPSSSDFTGLASSITVNASVDPTQGGDPTLLRDGGISDTSNNDYTYNTTGDSGYTGRLQQLISGLGANMTFSSSADLPTDTSLSGFAQASVSWVQAQNQTASSNSSYQQSLLSQASSALSNATGVNLDSELTNMLTIESSYTASAKLLTSVNDMLTSLLNAVNVK